MKLINWFLILLNKVSKDKLLHFFSGTVLLALLLSAFSPLLSYGILVFIATGKELIYDGYLGKGNMEVLDFVYTIFPILLHLIH
tara:strand:- start:73 stop:324 length:252 start_codon:yes stop_codon:yes gene_type:complete